MLNAGVLYKNQRGIMRIERIESITGVRTPGELALNIILESNLSKAWWKYYTTLFFSTAFRHSWTAVQ